MVRVALGNETFSFFENKLNEKLDYKCLNISEMAKKNKNFELKPHIIVSNSLIHHLHDPMLICSDVDLSGRKTSSLSLKIIGKIIFSLISHLSSRIFFSNPRFI